MNKNKIELFQMYVLKLENMNNQNPDLVLTQLGVLLCVKFIFSIKMWASRRIMSESEKIFKIKLDTMYLYSLI